MASSTSALAKAVDWDRLRDARGFAGSIPALILRLSTLTGPLFEEALGELAMRIWNQGAIFPATAPATGALSVLLDGRGQPEKSYLYEVLAAIAETAREAALADDAHPCAAGRPEDGLAVLHHLYASRARFIRDLNDRDATSRRLAARLLVSADDPATAAEVEDLFDSTTDPSVRRELLAGLLRLGGQSPNWQEFLARSLATETDPESRFLLRCAELATLRNNAPDACVEDLVQMFLASNRTAARDFTDTCGDPDQFVQALSLLSLDRRVAALCRAIEGTPDPELSILIAERLLRLVFDDQRANWGDASYRLVNRDGSEVRFEHPITIITKSLVRILLWPWLPFLRHRWPRDARQRDGIPFIDYTAIEGDFPPACLESAQWTPLQREAVATIARHQPLWTIYTNLWELFGLPSSRDEMAWRSGVLQ